jgi:hypothetical protein
MMFSPGPYGCFYDDLVSALAADDPEWQPPPTDTW